MLDKVSIEKEPPASVSRRLKISVALAVYNGERFISEQLESFVQQKRLPDELIVSDNCSTDRTVAIVRDFAARAPFPVRLYMNEHNIGLAKNFERAINECSGDIILLSDCDDVWYPNKLERYEEIFREHPSVGVLFSDADIVDEKLSPVGRTLRQRANRRDRRPALIVIDEANALRELLRGRIAPIYGNTMAFRASLKRLALPLPDDPLMARLGQHDIWTSLLAACVSKAAVLSEPLIAYRQHLGQWGANLAFLKHSDLTRAIRMASRGDTKLILPTRMAASLCERVATLEGIVRDDAVSQLRDWAHHLMARETLPAARLRRFPTVFRQFLTGRYLRYGGGGFYGIRTAVNDFIRHIG